MRIHSRSKLRSIALTIFLLLWSPLNAISWSNPMVRVLLFKAPQKVAIQGEGEIRINTDKGEDLGIFRIQEENPLEFFPLPSGIGFSDKKIESKYLEIISLDGRPIKTGDFSYRGDILIHLDSQWKLEVINRLSLEEYVMGLMKSDSAQRNLMV